LRRPSLRVMSFTAFRLVLGLIMDGQVFYLKDQIGRLFRIFQDLLSFGLGVPERRAGIPQHIKRKNGEHDGKSGKHGHITVVPQI
jgi:hypothetical protein